MIPEGLPLRLEPLTEDAAAELGRAAFRRRTELRDQLAMIDADDPMFAVLFAELIEVTRGLRSLREVADPLVRAWRTPA